MSSNITVVERHGRHFIGFRDHFSEVRLLPTQKRGWLRKWRKSNCPLVGEYDYSKALQINLVLGTRANDYTPAAVAEWFKYTYTSIDGYLIKVNSGVEIQLPTVEEINKYAPLKPK